MRTLATRAGVGLAALTVASTVFAASAGGARGQNTQTFEYDPTEGPAGVLVEVSGTCIFFDAPTQKVFVSLSRVVDGDEEPFDESQTYPVSQADGTWSGTFQVPFAAPADDYAVNVSCQTQDQVFDPSIEEPFVVTVGPVEPPATTTTTTTPPSVPTTLPPSPRPAPIVEEPAFTG